MSQQHSRFNSISSSPDSAVNIVII